MPSLEPRGENVPPSAKAIATGPTPVIWRQRRVGSRTSKYREIGKVNSTRRPLNATVAMNRTSRDQPDADVRGWDEHPQGGGSGSNPAGSGSQCQHDQSPQPEPHPAI